MQLSCEVGAGRGSRRCEGSAAGCLVGCRIVSEVILLSSTASIFSNSVLQSKPSIWRQPPNSPPCLRTTPSSSFLIHTRPNSPSTRLLQALPLPTPSSTSSSRTLLQIPRRILSPLSRRISSSPSLQTSSLVKHRLLQTTVPGVVRDARRV